MRLHHYHKGENGSARAVKVPLGELGLDEDSPTFKAGDRTGPDHA